MKRLRILSQLIRADFLERTRRYSFFITLGVMLYVGYSAVPPAESGMLTVDLGDIRGVYNSAWIGGVVALLGSMLLSLPGFYLVKNGIARDRETGVGQIIATTPLRKALYTLGKATSNFIFLAVIIAVFAFAAGTMQFIRGEALSLDVWGLVTPFLFVTLPMMALVAAVAVLFETIPFLRGGFGNIAYFAFYIAAATISLSGATFSSQGVIEQPINDLFGATVIGASMGQAAHNAFPDRSLNFGVGYSPAQGTIQTFHWEGVAWTTDVILGRLLWVGVALGIALLAALFFDRFDPARSKPKALRRNGFVARMLAPFRSLRFPRLSLRRFVALPRLPLPQGNYRFRADKDGTQFWSDTANHCTLPGCATAVVTTTIPLTVTVSDTDGNLEDGLRVYAFNGPTYTGYNKTTDVTGEVIFTLPQGDYRFRADKNGTQFWSGAENHCAVPGCLTTAVTTTIPLTVSVRNEGDAPQAGLPVYVFDEGTYTGYNGTTNEAGQVVFTLPQGDYRFRSDSEGQQYWSAESNHCPLPGCTAATITTPGGAVQSWPETTTITYTYDALYRLTDAAYAYPDGENQDLSFAYTYDAVGNRLTQETLVSNQSTVISYQYDVANRLISVDDPSTGSGQVAYAWDNNGNLLDDGERNFTYDHANRLISVTGLPSPVSYAYNGVGDRMQQTVNGETTTYVLDMALELTMVLAENKAGTQTAYLYGQSVIASFASGTWAYQHPDALGSVRQQTNIAGQVTVARGYAPFGETLWQSISAAAMQGSFGYAGEQKDISTGLTYLRSRYYNPSTGRFLTRDSYPAFAPVPQSLHRYAYVGNDPVNRVDPSGERYWDNPEDRYYVDEYNIKHEKAIPTWWFSEEATSQRVASARMQREQNASQSSYNEQKQAEKDTGVRQFAAAVERGDVRRLAPSGEQFDPLDICSMGCHLGITSLKMYLTWMGELPDYRGIEIAEKYVDPEMEDAIFVAAGIAIQSQWYGMKDTRWANKLTSRYDYYGTGLGYAQVSDVQMNTPYGEPYKDESGMIRGFGLGLGGQDQQVPENAVAAMQKRIQLVIDACKKCDSTDKFIAAALAQNGPGFTHKNMQEVASPISDYRDGPGEPIIWEDYFANRDPNEEWVLNYRSEGHHNFDTRFQLLLFYNDVKELQRRGWEYPGEEPNWDRIEDLTVGETP